MKIISAVCVINAVWVFSQDGYNYEKILKKYGLGKRVFQRRYRPWQPYPYEPPTLDTNQRPGPLPRPKMSDAYVPSVYHNLSQGRKMDGDKRVYNQRFDYPERNEGQHVILKGDFACVLSRLMVQTDWCIPILLRGGVGYRHFTVVVRADPGYRMKGRVRAWCRNSSDFYLQGNW